MTSPLIIKLALAYYVTPEPEQFFTKETWGSSAKKDADQWLVIHEIIEPGGAITEKGHFWIEAILSTPLPKRFYVVERSEQRYPKPKPNIPKEKEGAI